MHFLHLHTAYVSTPYLQLNWSFIITVFSTSVQFIPFILFKFAIYFKLNFVFWPLLHFPTFSSIPYLTRYEQYSYKHGHRNELCCEYTFSFGNTNTVDYISIFRLAGYFDSYFCIYTLTFSTLKPNHPFFLLDPCLNILSPKVQKNLVRLIIYSITSSFFLKIASFAINWSLIKKIASANAARLTNVFKHYAFFQRQSHTHDKLEKKSCFALHAPTSQFTPCAVPRAILNIC